MWKPAERIKFFPSRGDIPSRQQALASRLFSPVQLGPLALRHRTWVPAMVPWRSNEDGEVTDDVIQWCAGVMLFRSTQAVHDWWRLVLDMSRLLDMPDQETIAVLRGNAKRLPLPMSVLPADKVANWGTLGNREPWKGEPFTVPASAVVWHANWTIGIESKMAMLRAAASQSVCRSGW